MRKGLGIISLLLLFLGAAAGFAFWAVSPPDAGETVLFEVLPGDSTAAVAARLKEKGLIRNELAFKALARIMHADAHIQIGEYEFLPGLSAKDTIAYLVSGKVVYRSLTVSEGLSVEEIASLVEQKGFGSKETFLEICRDVSLLPDFVPKERIGETGYPLEGYLFPDTYYFPKGTTEDQIVKIMVGRFGEVFTEELRDEARLFNLDPHETATLASIVEREAAVDVEREIIAAVYLNRLAITMKLDACPTVAYAVGRPGEPISLKDLEVISPYNTYKNPGLPPGPISNFGLASLEAVLNPADVDYLYFVSKNDGTHAFSRTLSEHNANVRKYQQ